MGSNIPYDGEKDCTDSEYRCGALHCAGGGDVRRERKDSEVVGEFWANVDGEDREREARANV